MFNLKWNCLIPPRSKESSVRGILRQIMKWLIKILCNLFCPPKEKKPTLIDYPKYSVNSFDLELVDLMSLKQDNPLILDEFLCDVAYSHSLFMAKEDEVSHKYYTERAEQIRLVNGNVRVGEVVGRFYRSAEGAMHAFEESEEHNEIINKKWTSIGVAQAYTSRGNYITVIFETKW